jgi:subtilisin-like proprotein convertase family protein
LAPIELTESPGTPIPDFPHPGIERALPAAGPAKVAKIEVSVDIAHTWIGDLRVSLRSPSGKEVLLYEGDRSSTQNLVRTFTVANTMTLSGLAGEAVAGSWRLKVMDKEARDQGKLNSWKVLITPQT